MDYLGSASLKAPVNKTYVDTADSAVPSYATTPGQTLLNRFEKLRGVYNLKSSNTRRCDVGLGRCQQGGMSEHVWIGDSVSAGAVSAIGINLFDRLNSVPMSFRNALNNLGVPTNGTGMVRIVDSASFADSRWTTSGSWVNSASYAYAGTATSVATFYPDKSGTSVDILYFDYHAGATTGSWTIALDGTTIGTISMVSTAGVWKTARFNNLNVIGGQSKITATVTVLDSFGLNAIAGAEVWTPNAGLRVHNIAQSGSTAAGTGNTAWLDSSAGLGAVYAPVGGSSRQVTDAVSTSGSNVLTSATAAFTTADIGKPIDHIVAGAGQMFPLNSYISGYTSATQVSLSYRVGENVFPANAYASETAQKVTIGRPPDCVHIALGGNDLNAATPLNTIISAITAIRNRYPNSDCILHLQHEFSTTYVPAATTAAFQQAMFTLADTLDVPLYDWRDQIGTYAQGYALGWYGDNAVHLTSAAYTMLGSGLASLLGPGTGTVAQPTPARMLDGGTQTGAFTAQAGFAYTLNFAASLGAISITLPAAPPQGSLITLSRIDSNQFTTFANVVPGAGDSIRGNNPWVISASAATFLYQGTAWRAVGVGYDGMSGLIGPTSSSLFGNSIMARDSNGRAQVATPSTANDIANKSYVDALGGNMLVVTTATGITATANTWLRADPTTAGFTVTLPAAPIDGTMVVVDNVATSGSNLVSYIRGGTDTIEGLTTAYTLSPQETSQLTYRASNSTWYLERHAWNATAGTIVKRDNAGRTQNADPVNAQDSATKNYVDTKQLKAAVTSAAQALSGTTAFYVTPPTQIAANTAVVGDTWRFIILATNTATIQTLTITPRIGSAGTTADTALAAGVTLGAGTAANGNCIIEVTVTIRSTGAAGTAVVGWRYNGSGGMSSTGATAYVNTMTINTTATQFLGVSLTSTVANIVTVQDSVMEVVRKA